METCYHRPHPIYPSETSGIYPTYKSPLNDGVSPYTNGGFFINPASSQNGCTYVSHPVPTSFLSSASRASITDENRIILSGSTGSTLPSVQTLTTSCNNTENNQQESLMLSWVPGNSFCGGYSNVSISPGMVPSNFGISPSTITTATGW